MANQYSWQDALANNYSAGNYGNVPGRIMPWSRNTVADGWWLNRETLSQLSGRDQYLLDSINKTYDECSSGTGLSVFYYEPDGEHPVTSAESQIYIYKHSQGTRFYTELRDSSGTSASKHILLDDYPKNIDANVRAVPAMYGGKMIWIDLNQNFQMSGNYVSAYDNQKITLCTATELPNILQEGVYYLV